MAMGERSPLALLDAPASGRMAVGEAITNMAAARIGKLSDIRLSANWMAACGDGAEDAALYDTVRAVGEELCSELELAIPVGKDSLSMRASWQGEHGQRTMSAPISAVISAFAPTRSARATLTPQLVSPEDTESRLILADLGMGQNRLGGSAVAQVYGELGGHGPDLDWPSTLSGFFAAVQTLAAEEKILAYHDRSDGGLAACLAEMAFAARLGVDVVLDDIDSHPLPALFAEELGAVLQVAAGDADHVLATLQKAGVTATDIGTVTTASEIVVRHGGTTVLSMGRGEAQRHWAATSHAMAALRDDPACAGAEYDAILDETDPGLPAELSFDP